MAGATTVMAEANDGWRWVWTFMDNNAATDGGAASFIEVRGGVGGLVDLSFLFAATGKCIVDSGDGDCRGGDDDGRDYSGGEENKFEMVSVFTDGILKITPPSVEFKNRDFKRTNSVFQFHGISEMPLLYYPNDISIDPGISNSRNSKFRHFILHPNGPLMYYK